jgi:hypothetical protein
MVSVKLQQHNLITSERSTASFNQWLGICLFMKVQDIQY